MYAIGTIVRPLSIIGAAPNPGISSSTGRVNPVPFGNVTKGYFTEQDIFKLFVEEYYTIDTNGKIYAQNVYNDYRHWCEMNGEKYVSNIIFSKELQRLGIARTKDRNGIVYGLVPRECATM
mgnify:CR=1 FL=1